MARRSPIHSDFDAIKLSRIERSTARYHGLIDGALGVHCPLPGHAPRRRAEGRYAARRPSTRPAHRYDQHGGGAGDGDGYGANNAYGAGDAYGDRRPAPSWTPYLAEAIEDNRAVSNRLVSEMMADHRPLITRIYRQAGTVVREHSSTGVVSAGTAGRFRASLTEWRTTLKAARRRAQLATDHTNQRIGCYWGAVVRSHRRRCDLAYECAGLRPALATLDPVWTKADPFLLLSFGDADDEVTAGAGRTLSRALELGHEEGKLR